VNLSAKFLIKLLEEKGYIFKRSKGSHHIFYHPLSNKTIVVPVHGNKDLPKGTFFAIIKQAGIDKNEVL
jgi:predicted RNA binding protein YcfA (HicA-like mRNA interferase family)